MKLHILMPSFLLLALQLSAQSLSANQLDLFGQKFVNGLISGDVEAFKALTMDKESLIATITENTPGETKNRALEDIENAPEDFIWKENKQRLTMLLDKNKKLGSTLSYIKTDFIKNQRESEQIGFNVGSARVWFFVDGKPGVRYVYIDKMMESSKGWLCGEVGSVKNPEEAHQYVPVEETYDEIEATEEAEEEVEID